MTSVVAGAEREQLIQWMEEGRGVLEILQKILQDCDHFKAVAEAAQQDSERIQRDCEQLRAEVSRLKEDSERVQQERAENAKWFATMMSEAASRLRLDRPAA
jgi:cell shape-determining protein MreC